jgi:hypothetical protein
MIEFRRRNVAVFGIIVAARIDADRGLAGEQARVRAARIEVEQETLLRTSSMICLSLYGMPRFHAGTPSTITSAA